MRGEEVVGAQEKETRCLALFVLPMMACALLFLDFFSSIVGGSTLSPLDLSLVDIVLGPSTDEILEYAADVSTG